MHDGGPDETTTDIPEESFAATPTPSPILQTTLLDELQRAKTHAENPILAVALPPNPPRAVTVSKMRPLLGTLLALTELKQATS